MAFGFALALALAGALFAWCLATLQHARKLVIAISLVVVAIGLFYGEEDFRGRLQWRRFKARMEARGEKFDLPSLAPPPVPDDDNFALSPLVQAAYGTTIGHNGQRVLASSISANPLAMPVEAGKESVHNGIGNWATGTNSNLELWQAYYRKLSTITNVFPVPSQPQSAGADVVLALGIYDSTLDELRQAAALPSSRFPLDYANEIPFSILLPHLAVMKGCVKMLQLRILAELDAGKGDAALADTLLGLQLADKLRSEPFLISQLVRLSMWNLLVQPIWEGLERHRWTDAELSRLERQLATFDFVADYRTAMRGENATAVAMIDYLRHQPDQYRNFFDQPGGITHEFQNLSMIFLPAGWYYQNALHNSRLVMEQMLPAADVAQQTFSPSAIKQVESNLDNTRTGAYSRFSRLLLLGLAPAARKFAVAQATVDLARTACALERCHLADGNYPAKLEELAPRFIAKVPHDPIGGKPFQYRLADDGSFLLYSVGWNEKDDGGIVAMSKTGVDWTEGDIVWKYHGGLKP